jgi:hypothetical protein
MPPGTVQRHRKVHASRQIRHETCLPGKDEYRTGAATTDADNDL